MFLPSPLVVDEDSLLEALHYVAVKPAVPEREHNIPQPSPTRARFFIPEEDDEDELFGSYDDPGDDDEEDYGRLLRRPVYSANADYFSPYSTEFSMVQY